MKTIELRVSPSGVSESKPLSFDFTAQCAELGTGFLITGTPVIEYVGSGGVNDGTLTVGSVAVDGTSKLAQAKFTGGAAAAAVGSYRVVCRANLTDGVTTAGDIEVAGVLLVRKIT